MKNKPMISITFKMMINVLLTLTFAISSRCQNTYTGNIILDGQNKVDSFPINYPNIEIINGDLTIIDVNTLDSLYNLELISGNLDINGSLSNFNGLDSLSHVGQTFFINTTASSIICSGLSSLIYCANFRPEGNNTNISFNGLSNANLKINIMNVNGMNFNDFTGLSNTVKVDGLNLINCQFTNFVGFENIDSLDVLAIQNGTSFSNYVGFNSIEHIGLFLINDAINPPNFTGLETLTSINEIEFYLYYLGTNSLSGLNNIDYTKINSLLIFNGDFCAVPWLCDYFTNGNFGTIYGTGSCESILSLLQHCNQYTFTGTSIWTDLSNWNPTYPNINITNATIIVNGNVTIPSNVNIICNNCTIINNGNIILEGTLTINN